MPRIPVPSATIRGFQYVLENNFTGALKTEFTGLNFPENACTQTENCTFFHTGSVFRRNGFDYEANFATAAINRTNSALSTYVWNNAGGDGSTKIYVVQIGGLLYFYQLTNATLLNPLSTTQLVSTVTLSDFFPVGAPFGPPIECTYTSGNGYLFVFHPLLDPFYCSFSLGIVSASRITVQIRDFVGVNPEPGNPSDSFRPTVLNSEHKYNLQNQGWTSAAAWVANSISTVATYSAGNWSFAIGLVSFQVSAGIAGVTVGQTVNWTSSLVLQTGTVNISGAGLVNSYSGTTLVLNVTSSTLASSAPVSLLSESTTISPPSSGQITTWHTAIGNYPSNSDVWWTFKSANGNFSTSVSDGPTTTVGNVTLSSPAPKGSYILEAFTQKRSSVSGVTGITDVTTNTRPRSGSWFQGRVFYAGVDAVFPVTGDEPFYTWTEDIYFSQIITSPVQFGRCYQVNDPTSETLFDLLPSDGGVITIQGSGSIYKLVPITNGLLVFAANGIWFITGSAGIGFTATDYTITKVSAVQSISPTSYVDVLGYPIFWNEEGIYQVGLQSEQQGLSVTSLTLNTIKQFYDQIPLQSKKYARGSYNPITGQIQWIYRSTNESSFTDRYQFDSVLNFSMFTQGFYPWSLPNNGTYIHDVTYIVGPGGSTSPPPVFKYLTSTAIVGGYLFTFSEERDNVNWEDWFSTGSPVDYTSFFVTGYRLHGDAQRKWQPGYVYVYSDNSQNTSYIINGKWNYAISGASGKYSSAQVVTNNASTTNFSKQYRRHRIRGHGTVLQLQISSVSGTPFHIDGWSIWETQNASV